MGAGIFLEEGILRWARGTIKNSDLFFQFYLEDRREAHDVDVVHEGDGPNGRRHAPRILLNLGLSRLQERAVLVELLVVVLPRLHEAQQDLPEVALVRDHDQVDGVREEIEDVVQVLERELHLLRAHLVVAQQAERVVEGDDVVLVGLLDRDDVVPERIVGSELLVDALIVLEHAVELGARDGVEEARDLPLQHVLGEAGKDGHLALGRGTHKK